jgi:renalase
MHIAVVGAGAAGLAAARALRQRHPEVSITIYEKSRGLGGRAATRRRDSFAFDHGAQVIKAPSGAVRRLLLEELDTGDLRVIERPVWAFDSAGSVVPGDPALNAETSYYYRDGNNRLGKLLAEGLDVRREVRIGSLKCKMQNAQLTASAISHFAPCTSYELYDTSGEQVGSANAVLLTAPAGQSAEIVAASELDASLKEQLAAALARGVYRRCISLALAYARPLERPYYALINADRTHPIAWLALEHTKGAERCPPGHSLLLAQMAPGWSNAHWDDPADQIGPQVAALASDILGEDLRRPLWWDRQGWRYSQPDATCDFGALNSTGSGLFFAGDFAAGQGRVHLALESGWRAAELLEAYVKA